uniref:Protein with signal anchor n=1 Tax=Lutzomyia longipalpis TaxID=7200 RepID=A0A1B0CQC5_LUTLO
MLSKQVMIHIGAGCLSTGFMSWLQFRPLGILFIVIFGIWLYKWRCPGVRLVSSTPIMDKLDSSYKNFVKLRQEKPGIFCTIVSFFLVLLALLGHIVSGTWIVLIGLMMAALISTRHKLDIIHERAKGEETTWSSQTTDHDVDDFLPEVNEGNLFVLQKAGEEAVITTPVGTTESHTSSHSEDPDSLPVDLLLPEGSFPDVGAVNDDEESDLNDDELERDVAVPSGGEFTFKTGHFNRDTSSSSDDDSMARGLSFHDYSLVDAAVTEEVAAAKYPNRSTESKSNLPFGINEAWNVVGNLLKTSTANPITTANPSTSTVDHQNTRKSSHTKSTQRSPDSSDESEFETFTPDELNSAS